jgi:hypothetical protein
MLITADFHFLQMVIIQDAVIYLFTGGAFPVNGFVFVTAPGNPGMGPEAGSCFYVNGPSITALGAFFQAPACLDASALQRAVVFLGVFSFVISPAAHPAADHAQRMSGFIQGNVFRKAGQEELRLLMSIRAWMSQWSKSL